MSESTAGFKARLEYVLDQVCIDVSDGGSHEMGYPEYRVEIPLLLNSSSV